MSEKPMRRAKAADAGIGHNSGETDDDAQIVAVGQLRALIERIEDTYEDLNRKLPNIGDFVTTEDGLKGEVHSVSVLRQTVKVLVEKDDEKDLQEYKVEQLRFKRKRRNNQIDLTDRELGDF